MTTPQALVRLRPPQWCVLGCAALLPLLMTGSWLVADALQPTSYSPLRQTISVLAGRGGHDRWIVTAALAACGCCYLAVAGGAVRLRLRARVGLVVAGLCAVGIALCPEPARGTTLQHLAFTALGAVVIAIWPALAASRDRSQPALLGAGSSASVTALYVALLGWFAVAAWTGSTLGLAERVASSAQLCWPTVAVLALIHAGRRGGVSGTDPGGRGVA